MKAGGSGGSHRRRNMALVVVAAAVLSAGIGIVVGKRLQSPADAAANAAPPVASRITVPVEKRSLTARLIANGDVQFNEPTPLRLAGSVGASGGATQIITSIPEQDRELSEGDIVMEVSGRPVFVFQGTLPTYRPFEPGTSGPDVEQLEAALLRLGFDSGPVDGVYDDATETAIDQLYFTNGYGSEGPTPEQRTQLRAAEKAATDARQALARARQDLATAGKPPTGSELIRLQQQLKQATDAVPAAQAAADKRMAAAEAAVATATKARDAAQKARDAVQPGSSVTTAERVRLQQQLQAAKDAVPAATSAAARRNADALAAVNAATTARNVALAARDVAAAAAAAAKVPGAINPDTGVGYTAPEILALDNDKLTKDQLLADAEATLRAANSERDAAAIEGTRSIKQAQDALVLAQLEYDEALANDVVTKDQALAAAEAELRTAIETRDNTAVEVFRAIIDAQDALVLARLSYDEALAPKDVDVAQEAVKAAEDSVAQADLELLEVQSDVGTKFPAGEMIFLPSLPTTITQVSAEAGKAPGDPVATVSGTTTLVKGRISAADAELVTVPTNVDIELRDVGIETTGRLIAIEKPEAGGGEGGDPNGGGGETETRLTIVIEPDDPALLSQWVGFGARISITVQSTAGDVLAVPVAALSVGPDGDSRVEVEVSEGDGPDAIKSIPVEIGLSAEGYAEVTPLNGETLNEGDRLVVGTDTGSRRRRSDADETETTEGSG
jgi:Putative peptidoglycan binding domain